MTEGSPFNHEKVSCIGLSTLEVAQRVIDNNTSICAVNLRPYIYVPNQTSNEEERAYEVSRAQFLGYDKKDLDNWLSKLCEGYNIALDSSVVLGDGNRGHLIMADLAPQKSDENLDKIRNRFGEIIKPKYGGGYFLETKRSYQFIGDKVVSQDEWYKLLGNLLISSIVTVTPDDMPNKHEIIADYRYIGHSLKRGTTGLRLTTSGQKTFTPSVVDYI